MVYLVSPNDDRNYGAVLQATALQDFLTDLGFDSQFITVRKNLNYMVDVNARSIKGLVKSLFIILHRKELLAGCKSFDVFVEEHQKCTKVYENYYELDADELQGDAYIVGSDQIWPETNLLPLNMLSFVPPDKIKISYAASLGKDSISKEKQKEYREFLSSFTAVSLREGTAVPAIAQVYDKTVECHVDPTLLYKAEYWEKKEKKYTGKLPPKYILLYLIYTPKDINHRIKELKRKTGLPIVLISNTPYKNVSCDLYIRDAGPAEFLWLVHHAEGVAASSFHGCVFSIIYKKPLLAINNPIKKARLANLLEKFDMQDCMEWNDNFLSDQIYDDNRKDELLSIERERSADYLRRYIKK